MICTAPLTAWFVASAAGLAVLSHRSTRIVQLSGPVVLQVASTTNLLQSTINQDHHPSMIMLKLTDGHSKILGIEFEPLRQIGCAPTAAVAARGGGGGGGGGGGARSRASRTSASTRPQERSCESPMHACAAASYF